MRYSLNSPLTGLLCGLLAGLFFIVFCFLASTPGMAGEIRPGEKWIDNNGVMINAHGGGILYYNGQYWWFGEHKIEGDAGNRAEVGVHCYSSRNLTDWTDEGIALAVSEEPENPIAWGCILERPKVLYNEKNQKFVMYFHLERKSYGYSDAMCGIAVAEQVTGPYHFVRCVHPCAKHWPKNSAESDRKPLSADELEKIKELHLTGAFHPEFPVNSIYRRDFESGQMARDMTLFQDEDGTAWHVYSSEENGVLHLAKLTDDYLGHTGEYYRIFPGRFNEAPALMKRNGRYWLISSGCTGWAPNPARLAVADSITGPWQELPNPCRGTDEQKSNTFQSQSTFILPIAGKPDQFIFMADRWNPENAIDGRYIWLPIQFDADGTPYLEWQDVWSLD